MKSIFLKNSIPDLKRKLNSKELSCDDLAMQSIQEYDLLEEKVKAWVVFEPEALKAEAARSQARYDSGQDRATEGIPFGVKDIFNTSSFPTQMGSRLWQGFMPGNNARVVDSFINQGAIVAGKTVTAEFAVHALNETLNPHDLTRTPGTSSSGSVAAVATGMVPFALATQTAGSIVRPASFCGVWGMKPSFGLIPRTGVLKTTDSLDSIGFVASMGNSLRPLLDVSRVKGPDYPFVYRNVDPQSEKGKPKSKDRKWRAGFVRTHTWAGAERYAQDAVVGMVSRIAKESGYDVEEIAWSDLLSTAHEVHRTIYNKSLAYYFQHEAKNHAHISPIMAEMIETGRNISPEQLRQALRQQEVICSALNDLLSGFDFVISLGTSSSAPERGVEEIPDPSLIWTLGHLPSIAVPAFRCPNGLPFGLQVVSRRWNDYLLLQATEELIERGVFPEGSQELLTPAIKKQMIEK